MWPSQMGAPANVLQIGIRLLKIHEADVVRCTILVVGHHCMNRLDTLLNSSELR